MANETFTATQTTVLANDIDLDGQIDPGGLGVGDTVTTTVTITNNSTNTNATGVTFTENANSLNGMTLVNQPGDDINVSPLAFDDSYNAVGNTPLTVSAANGVLGGAVANIHETFAADTEFFSQTIGTGLNDTKVVAGTFATSQGGSVTIAADGSFTYTPALGFSGTGASADTFTYTLRDAGLNGTFGNTDDLTGTGTVSIDVGPVIWYIDASAPGGGNGTKDSPFNSIAAFNAVNDGVGSHPAAGDIVFLRSGTYSEADGINLLNNQQLIGEGEGLTITPTGGGNPVTIYPAGTPPIINASAGDGIDLASGNTIKGLTINNTSGADIADNGDVGALNISNVSLTGTGQAIDIDSGGTLNVSLNSVTTTSSTGQGIQLVGVGGSFAVTGAVNISGTTGAGIDIQNSLASSSFTFSGSSDAINTGAQTAVNFTGNNATSSLSFTNGGLDIDTTSGSGFVATGGGTVNVTGSSNSVTTTTGQIVNMSNVSVGGSGVTFATLQSTGVINNLDAVLLNNVDGGTFNGGALTVAGTTGGSSNAIDIEGGSAATVQFTSATIDNTGSTAIQIFGAAGDGTVTIGTVDIDGAAGNGISIVGNTNTVNINGGSIGATNDPSAAGVHMFQGTGNVNIAASVTKTTAGDIVDISGRTGGTINITNDLTSSGNGGGIDLAGNTGATINFTDTLTINTSATGAIGFNATGGGTVNATGSGSTISSGIGTALNVVGTTIGASDLTFQSISSNGGSATGIILDNTGTSGGLHVTGLDGADAGTDPDAGSGGTIANKTGADGAFTTGNGIYLNNTADVRLAGMQLNDFQNSAIRGFGVNGFSLEDSVISGTIGTSTGEIEGAIAFGHVGPAFQNGLTGNSLIDNVNISGSIEHHLEFYNQSGTMNLTISNSNIHDNSVAGGSDGIQMEIRGTAQAFVNIDTNQFSNNKSQAIQLSALESSTLHATIQSNTITRGTQGNEGILVTNGGDADARVLIGGPSEADGNIISGFGGVAIFVGQVPGQGTNQSLLEATIQNNTVTSPVDATNHAILAFLSSQTGQVSQARLLIDDNTVTYNSAAARAILVDAPDSGRTPNFYATVTDNTVTSTHVDAVTMISVAARNGATGHTAMSGNDVNFTGGSTATGINVREASPGTNELARGGSASNDSAVVLAANNPLSTTTVIPSAADIPVVENNTILLPVTPTLPSLPLLAAEGGVEAAPADEALPADETPPAGDTPLVDGGPPAEQPSDSTTTPAHSVIVDDGVLSQAELDYFVDAAIARWSEAGMTEAQLDALEAMSFGVADMSGLNLGSFSPSQITLDADAAGRGWYLDGTPLEDSEFGSVLSATWLQTDPTGEPAGHYDLLTTVMHEMGHALGLGDSYASDDRDELMFGWLYTGERRLPGADDADGAVAGSITEEEFLGAPVDIGVLPFGKSVTIQWQATINAQNNQLIVNPTNQGTVAASNPPTAFPDKLTDDPAVGGANDATVTTLDTLVLGNLVFNDANKDGLFNAGDSGVNGVTLSLFADATNDGVIDNEGAPLATATTAGGGLYSFAGLAPGHYIVRVDLANFQGGGALNALNLQVSSTGNADPDDNVDNDDNGSRAPGAAAYSQTITLAYNTEPTAGTGNDTNDTLDFGFISNTPPTAANVGPFTGAEDATSPARIAIILSGADADVGDAVLSFTIATLAANGQLFDAATGGTLLGAGSTVPATGSGPWTATVYFQPNADFNGSTSFTYIAFDGDQNSAAATASITVNATNDPVTGAAPANASVNEDAPTAITGLSIADVDTTLAPGGTYQVTLSSTIGTLTLGAGTLAVLSFTTGDGTADATMTFTGTLANINTALATASYTSDLDFNGSATITLQVTDDVGGIVATGTGAGTSDSDVINVTVNATNDPVTGTAPANASVNEDTPTAITGMSIADVDATLAPGGTYQVTLSSTIGTLTLGAGTLAALSFTTGDGTADATMTFTGTLANINTALGTASYAPNADFNGSATVTLQVTDDVGGIVATGIGAGTSDSDVINVTVNATNDPVTGTAPANTSVAEDGSVAIAGMSIADVDATLAPGGTYQVILSSTTGTLTLGAGTLAVLSFSTGDGSADATMTFTGTLANINTALATASYTSDPDFNGAATITLQVTDDVGGIVATGTGAGTSDSDVINVTVNAVADIVADTLTTTEDNAVTANVITGTNGASADNFEAAAVIQSVTQGTNGAVTFLANGEVTYTPNDDFNGVDTFQYTVLSGGVTETATVTVNIGAVNDDPVVANPIADQASPSNAEWSFQVPEDAFDDVDGDVLTHAASLDGNPLPAWLTFNGANRTFTGTPPLDFVGQLALKVTASDASLASVSDTFNLDIVQSPSPDINLSEGDDNFIGTGLGEVINGLGGNDNIQGGAGNDRINGNAGNDNILGGSGANVLHGNDGGDFLTAVGNLNVAFGDTGSDQLFFVGSQNQLYGSEDNDWLGVSGSSNALAGGAGDDFLGASGNGNTLAGQDGTDFLFAVGVGNALHGEAGNDWLGVSGNSNSLFGGAGNDWLGATGNNNVLDGGAGNDTLVAAPGGHLADVFNYRPGYAQDEVIGFSRHNAGGTDVVSIQGFGVTTFAQLQGFMTQSGGDTVITLNTGDILTVRNVVLNQWQADDFQLA